MAYMYTIYLGITNIDVTSDIYENIYMALPDESTVIAIVIPSIKPLIPVGKFSVSFRRRCM